MTCYPEREKTYQTARFRDVGLWQHYINQHCPQLDITSTVNDGFSAVVHSFHLSECAFMRIGSTGSSVVRTATCARRADAGYLKVVWQLAGRMTLSQDQRTVDLSAGGASVCDTTRPYRMELSDDARLAVLMIPHHVDSRLPRHVRCVSATEAADTATMQAVLGALQALVASQPAAATQSIDEVMHCVIMLLAGSFRRACASADMARDARRMHEMRRFIETHLASDELGPERLAEVLSVSRRSLYTLCARHGTTPARLIADVRLQRARDALACDRYGVQSITEIALAHGFSDGARFSHVFKKRFGQAPSHWRSRHAGI